MSQGKAYTPEQRESILLSLKEYLELGFSRAKSCILIGLAPTTLQNWLNNDESLGIKLEGWENSINKMVMANIRDSIRIEKDLDTPNKETTKWWAERRMKQDFSTKVETDLNIKELPKPILDVIQENNSDSKDNESKETS